MMDRYEAQYSFWASFGVPAYEENSVPDLEDVTFPYITYQAAASAFDEDARLSANVWTRSTSWLQADTIANAIIARLKDGGENIAYDGGCIWVTPEAPLVQNMGDPEDDRIKRKLVSVVLHFS